MFKKKKVKVIVKIILLFAIVAIVGYHGYCHHMVGKLYKYIRAGNTEGALSCIEKMPNVNMLDKCRPLYNIEGILLQYSTTEGYPLECAVWEKADVSVIKALLEKGADVNKKNFSDSPTPIQRLYSQPQKDMYEKLTLLIEYGADASECHIGFPTLWEEMTEESKECNFRIIVCLWENGVDEWEFAGTEYARTVLHSAVEILDAEYLEKLYKNEKRPMNELLNALDANGETPLFYAVREGKFDNCSFLIEEGADITIKNNEGKTAYDIAVELGYEEYAEGLMPNEE